MRELPHTHGCFVCGESNACGLKLRFETDGGVVRTRFVAREQLIGFKEVVHGGVIATVLDEIMVWACAVGARRFAYCAEITVRFNSPLRPGQEALVTGELVRNLRGRLFEAKGEVRDDAGQLLASATGKYLPIKDAAVKEMLGDVIGDASVLLDSDDGK